MPAGLDHDYEEMRCQLLELGGVDAYNVLKNANPDAPDALDVLLKMEDARKKAVTDVAAADRTRGGSAYDPTAQPGTIQAPPFATDEGGNLVTTYPELPYYGEMAGYVDCRPLTKPARDEFVDRYDPIDGHLDRPGMDTGTPLAEAVLPASAQPPAASASEALQRSSDGSRSVAAAHTF